jgi:hypothetical protein
MPRCAKSPLSFNNLFSLPLLRRMRFGQWLKIIGWWQPPEFVAAIGRLKESNICIIYGHIA